MTEQSDFANGTTVPPHPSSPQSTSTRTRQSISGTTGHFRESVAPKGKDIVQLMRAPTFDHYDPRLSPCVRTEPRRKRKRNPNLPHANTMPTRIQEADVEAALRQVVSAPTGPGSVGEQQRERPAPVPDTDFHKDEEVKHPYLVFGIYNRVDGRPQEDMLILEDGDRLFMDMFWAIAGLRGPAGLFSLKDVKQFSIFTCDTTNGTHRRMRLDQDSEDTLHQFFLAYSSWSSWSDVLSRPNWLLRGAPAASTDAKIKARTLNRVWANWLHEALNNSSCEPALSVCPVDLAHIRYKHDSVGDVQGGEKGARHHPHYSLEVVLGWSPGRIGAVVFTPVLISLVVGLVLNSRGWSETDVIEMSWAVGTYVATSGGILAALLAIVSEIQKPAERVT